MACSQHIRPIAIALAACAGAAPGAAADVIASSYTSQNQFLYELSHMPDLDQRRTGTHDLSGLALDGAMYCVPTSAVNLVAYIANHGFGQVQPGPGYWQSNSLYEEATLQIAQMGFNMGTHPANGTGGYAAREGCQRWLGDDFTVSLYYPTDDFRASIVELTQIAMQGNIASMAYGRYEYLGTLLDVAVLGDRVGGHAVTFVKAERNVRGMTIGVRDSADDPDKSTNPDYLTTQSIFSTRVFSNAALVPTVRSGESAPILEMTALSYPFAPGTTHIALMDSYLAIGPKFGMTFEDQGAGLFAVKLLRPRVLQGSAVQPEQGIGIALPGGMLDAALHPNLVDVALLHEGADGEPALLKTLNPITGDATDVAEVRGGRRIVFGRRRELYILAGDALHCMNLDGPDGKPVMTTIPLPGAGDAIAFDDEADEVIVLGGAMRKIWTFSAGLPRTAPARDIPLAPGIELEGAASIAVSPVDGTIWLGSEFSPDIFGSVPDAPDIDPKVITLPAVQHPTSLEFDDGGHLFVSGPGGAVEMELSPLVGRWSEVGDPYFAGFKIGPVLRISRSRTNFDPAIHSGPAFHNLHPDDTEPGVQVADCTADLTGDRLVNVQDLLSLLAAWGPGEARPADLDDDQVVGVTDLLALLEAWGACP